MFFAAAMKVLPEILHFLIYSQSHLGDVNSYTCILHTWFLFVHELYKLCIFPNVFKIHYKLVAPNQDSTRCY